MQENSIRFKKVLLLITVCFAIIMGDTLTVNADQGKVIDNSLYVKIYSTKCKCWTAHNSVYGGHSEVSPDCFFAWTGKPICPNVLIKDGNYTLKEGVDYTITYANNVDIGSGKVIVKGKGEWEGTSEYEFSIHAVQLDEGKRFTFNLSKKTFTADGTKKDPKVVSIKDNWRGVYLKEGVDYEVRGYLDDVYAGTGSVCILGKNNYEGVGWTGSRGLYFSCAIPYTINGISLENADIRLKKTVYTYDGSAKTPTVTAKYKGKKLVKGKDYILRYRNNEDDGTAYVYIVGKGIYTDTVKMSFVILPYNSGMDAVYGDGTFISKKCVYGITDEDDREVELCCPATKNIKNLKVPATITCGGIKYKVTSIGHKAFYKNKKIETLEVGNNVKNIENYAFYACTKLKSVKFGAKLDLIGSSSFRKCTKLTSVTLPKNLDELGKNAFYGCTKLKTITINAKSVVDIDEGAIKNISKKAVIKVPAKHFKRYKKIFKPRTGFRKTMRIKKK